jgi:hypothetical protein
VLERGLSLWKQAYVLDVSKHDPRGIKWEYRYIFCGFQKENGAAESGATIHLFGFGQANHHAKPAAQKKSSNP